MLALAASAGAHAGLVPSHAAERPLVAMLFAASALVLASVSVLVDRSERRAVVLAAGLLLGGLLALYGTSRMVVSGRSRMWNRSTRSAWSPSCSRRRA